MMHPQTEWQLQVIPALNDNYVWLLSCQQQAIIVDPGEAQPVLEYLIQHAITPIAILITHHHADHIAGVAKIAEQFAELSIYGPADLACQFAAYSYHRLHDQTQLTLLNRTFQIIATPGHTLDHLVYYSAPYLFSGDTLFAAGCGRVFEGSYAQMWSALQQLRQLPDETLLCCAHEYTLANLQFAQTICPDDLAITQQLMQVKQLRASGCITLPTTLELEKSTNLFLRCDEPALQQRLQVNSSLDAFTQLREQKNNF